MRMPEPEEDKVTVTGGGLHASGLLKLGSVRRSLLQLKKGRRLQCALTKSFHAVCCCACVFFFDRTTRLSRLRLLAASNRTQETSEQTYVMIVVYATIHYAIQLNSVTQRL